MLPVIQTALPGPRARAVIERDLKVMSPSYTRPYPLVADSGEGAIIVDPDGNRFLDFSAGIAVTSTGHCHPDVVAAIQRQAARLLHMSATDFYQEGLTELAEKLAGLAPGPGEKMVFFGNTGAEAVEAAIKLARHATGRRQFVAFYGAFHGRSMGALSLTASRAIQKQDFFPMMPGVHHVPYADCYRCAYGRTPDTCSVECVKAIEDPVLRTVLPANDAAAVVVEPVQGEGGYIVPPQKFFDELRRLTRKHGMLLVVDEVQAGMGRTGKLFASEHFGLEPDILTSAKGIASGMPLSATIARRDLMTWQPGQNASTFAGNPVSVAAGLATLKLLENSVVSNAAAVGAHLKAGLTQLMDEFPVIGDVRGLGLMIGVELVKDRVTKERHSELRDRVVQRAFEKGLLLLGAGPNTLRLCPPLIITREQADFAVATIRDCLRAELAAD